MDLAVLGLMVLSVMSMASSSIAAVYKVGDAAGWTTIGNVDYKQWSATKSFQVGDVIVFEYNAQFHNVMRVTHAMYKVCNVSSPIATFTTGNDSITITKHGHHFFFCGVPGHCQAGQKVDINILRTSSTDSPPPSPLSAPLVPSAGVPGPSPSTATSLGSLKGSRTMFGITLAIFAVFVFGWV